jgi:membrane protein YdbS with pleckstrin-like domain
MEEDVEGIQEKRITLADRSEVTDVDDLMEGEPVYHLDPGVRIYWSVGVIAAGLVVWIILMVVAGLTMDSILGVGREMFPLFFFTLIALLLFPYLVWVELNYHDLTYQFRKSRLVIRKGVLNKERTVIPYTQIQNVNINRNVLQRMLGIATVKIETAGTNPWESEGVIDGIGDYHRFVQHVMELVERSKRKEAEEEKKPEKREEDTELFYLKQILVQLIELKKVMETKIKPETAEAVETQEEVDRMISKENRLLGRTKRKKR